MHGEPSLSESDIIFCEYTDNQIYVGYFAHIGNPWFIDERLVDLYSCYYDENNCGNLPSQNAPPIPMLPPLFMNAISAQWMKMDVRKHNLA